jgi:hypothetical protein
MYTGTTVQRHKDEDHRRALPVTDKDREWSRFCADDTCPRKASRDGRHDHVKIGHDTQLYSHTNTDVVSPPQSRH